MGRSRKQIPAAIEAEIARRTARGESAATIVANIGPVLSIPTVVRRQRELRGGKAGSKGRVVPAEVVQSARPAATDAVDVPDSAPDGTSLEQMDDWIRMLTEARDVARANGNLSAMASLAQKAATLLALRQRYAPAPKVDPNESPDMQALAAQARERLARLAHAVFSPDSSR